MQLILDIADAVAAELTDRKFSVPFRAVRRLRPRFTLDELQADLKVSVAPGPVEREFLSRGQVADIYAVGIAFQHRVRADECDPMIADLLAVVDEVGIFLTGRHLAAVDGLKFEGIEHNPTIAAEHIEDHSVLTSIITVRYRVIREF